MIKNRKFTIEHIKKLSEAHKGKKHLDEVKNKISISLKGKKFTKEHMANLQGINKGKKMSKETRNKISLFNKGIKRPYVSKKLKGKAITKSHRLKIGLSRRGSKSHFWKGGISPITKLIRSSNKYKEWRQAVFIRDNFICQRCDKTGYLEVHHKKPFYKFIEEIRCNLPLLDLYEAAMIYEPLWDIKNGETVCKECHNKTRGFK